MVMTEGSVLELRAVTKRFGDQTVVDAVDLSVASGEIVAIVGSNGVGKSTLLDIISGLVAPDHGEIHLDGHELTRMKPWQRAQVGLGRAFQDVRLAKDLSVRANISLGAIRQGEGILQSILHPRLNHREAQTVAESAIRIAERLGIRGTLNQTAGTLSAGQQRLVSVGRLLAGDFTCLALDEPFSGLSKVSTEKVEVELREFAKKGTSLVVIDHHRARAHRIADRVLEMKNGKLFHLSGPSSGNEVAVAPVLQRPAMRELRSTSRLLSIEDLTVSYSRHQVLSRVNLEVGKGEIVAVFGANGSGKSTLLRAVAGATASTGQIEMNGVDIACCPTHERIQHGLRWLHQKDNIFPALKVQDHLDLSEEVRKFGGTARVPADLIGFIPRRRRAGLLSGGQRQRLGLAALSRQGGKMWLLDEPTSGLDPEAIGTFKQVVRAAADYGIGILLIEQNQRVAHSLADRIVEIQSGQISQSQL